MKKRIKQWIPVMSCIIMCLIVCLNVFAEDKGVTILFTHDMHDHFVPQQDAVDGQVLQRGGYSKLKTLIDEERAKGSDVLVVDAGDFSMGTVFQTIYNTHAPELRLMGQMGYDVVTLGNHEFDYRNKGLTEMLEAAVASGEQVPTLVASNITDIPTDLQSAMTDYGVKPYTIVEKEGFKIGVFGLMGVEAASNAPMADVTFLDPIEEAKQRVEALQNEKVDMIVCLSHSGTKANKKKSEDEKLAKEVPGIDVIISGHTHTTLEEPIQVGNTLIVSSGENGEYLGKLQLNQTSDKKWALAEYQLLDVGEKVAEDTAVTERIQYFSEEVEKNYLSHFGFKSNETVAFAAYGFEESSKIGAQHGELRLGNLITDAYKYAIKEAEGDDWIPVDVAIVPNGVIRGSFIPGNIGVEDVFRVSSLGIGADGVSGYPLVSAYVTGKELKTICEVDASIAPIMSVAQLYMSGMNFTFNPNRLMFNKVTDAYLLDEKGQPQPIEDEKLYRITAGLYSAQMLSLVGEQSFGILSIVPKDKDGKPIEDFEKHIITDKKTGREVKEWVALADYMQSFEKVDGVAQLPARYADLEGRKVVDDNHSFMAIMKNPNGFAWMVYGIGGAIILLIVGIVVIIVKKKRKK
ncbi:MAG: bifunctional metallophosphatase/5'-nucleotidase [Cellulosilyticaceae bacterium]